MPRRKGDSALLAARDRQWRRFRRSPGANQIKFVTAACDIGLAEVLEERGHGYLQTVRRAARSGIRRHGLTGARFVEADLSGVVMRGVDVQGADIDAPWLLDGEGSLRVNGVNVAPFVDAELNRRFPGRARAPAKSMLA